MYSPGATEAKCPICYTAVKTTSRMQTVERQMIYHLRTHHGLTEKLSKRAIREGLNFNLLAARQDGR